MRSRWLLSVAACLLGTGIALAQPNKKPPLTSTGEPRTVIPTADPKTPVNRLPERPVARGFANEGEERAVIPEVGRYLLQGERGQRGYMTPEHATRVQSGAPARDSALLKAQPGEKTNRIPDRPAERNLLPSDTSRENLLPRTTGPSNRQGTQEKRAIER